MSTKHCKLSPHAFISGSLSKSRCLPPQRFFMGNSCMGNSCMGNSCISSRAPSSLMNAPNRRPRLLPTTTYASANKEERERDNLDDSNSEMHVYKKRGQKRESSQGDMLPFDVSIGTPPPEYLGRFRLDPRTHCGDIVEHDGRHFVVKSVRMRYKYLQGKYRMIGKAIEVKSLARKSIETYLEKTLRES